MFSAVALLLLAGLGALYFVARQNGKWRQRARAVAEQNEKNRKAHEIQNNIVTDPALRERVRRYFDRS